MAELNPLSAAAILGLAPRVLTALAPSNATPEGRFIRSGSRLDAAARADVENGTPVTLNATDARAAITAAIADARTIRDTLDTLYTAVAQARTSSLVGGTVQLTIDGTRISRLHIQAEARRALADINALVQALTRGGVNFIASDARPIEVQTTRFGGAIVISPQALDSRGLGLGTPELSGRVGGFRAVTDNEIEQAERALARGRELASRRLQTLEGIEERLAFSSAGAQAIRTLDQGARATIFARGSVVNLIA
ncbi:MAG: hypothetical protein EXR04_07895 [Rhodospirillales bacterium]|nr:hypothetical protein [Rhodospirillales bacterium]